MIRRALIANRGEIAVRIVRACRALRIEAVQVYSDADRGSLAVRMADRAIGIGRAPARESYLNAQAILAAARFADCDAIHPGYGFLSENAAFAQLCRERGFTFVGPPPEVIRLMGDKAAARACARELGLPVVPGSDGPVKDAAQARDVAARIGFPVLLKASSGGGGKGMRIVQDGKDLDLAFSQASAEAGAAFGDSSIYVERFLTDVRHLEVQVLADGATFLHLGERDCTIQRRHQKLIEETPSPAIGKALRARLTDAAVRLAAHTRYSSAGTVEFVLDNRTQDFYFIEMNTRLQVEHPVTEMVSGIDLVEAQFRIAAGEPLWLTQRDIHLSGSAIELRINAEDPARGFLPQPGTLSHVHLPAGPGIRVDTHAVAGAEVPPFYDSLLAKLIGHGKTRSEALARLRTALDDLQLGGVVTTTRLLGSIIRDPGFVSGAFNTGFVETFLAREAVQ